MDFSDALYVDHRNACLAAAALYCTQLLSAAEYAWMRLLILLSIYSRLVNLGVGALMVVGGIFHIILELSMYVVCQHF
jgi:hypothetical protein